MEESRHSVFTPFTRRFTDERARDLKETISLYNEVRALHLASPYAKEQTIYQVGGEIYAQFAKQFTDDVLTPLAGALREISDLEKAIFSFPQIETAIPHLTLQEQVDLRRFLRAKQYFLAHEERVIDLFKKGLQEIFATLTYGMPETLGPSPFSVPIINTLHEPRLLVDRIYNVVGSETAQQNGLFSDLLHRMYENLCRASKVMPYTEHKKPFVHAMDVEGPLDEMVETYLGGTPFHDYLLSPIPLKVTHEQRFSHMHIVGGSGAGKTQLLQSLILHDLNSDEPPALVIVDSQGDLINKLSHLAVFDPDSGKLADRLVIISPKEIEHPPALNVFDVKRLGKYDRAMREQVTAGVIQTFDYLFAGLLGADLTAKQSVFFRYVARLMLAIRDAMGRNATILDMVRLMEDAEPYRAAIQSLPEIPRQFFERDFNSKGFVQTKEQIRYRLHGIIENPTMARLFTSPSTKVDLFAELNKGSIILVDTAKDFLKGASAQFGKVFISLLLQAVLERAAVPERERKDAFLICDEAASYFDNNIDDLLTEARKYRLGCVFAHQFLDQCTSSLRASLAANTSIKMAAGVSMADARNLAPDMRTTPEFILSQPKLHFACHIRNVTPQAVSIPVTAGKLEAEPRLTREAYERLRRLNNARVSGAPEPGATPQARATTGESEKETESDW